MFYENIKAKQIFCGRTIRTEGVFITQMPSNAGISVWQTVWVATYCHLTSNVLTPLRNVASVLNAHRRQMVQSMHILTKAWAKDWKTVCFKRTHVRIVINSHDLNGKIPWGSSGHHTHSHGSLHWLGKCHLYQTRKQSSCPLQGYIKKFRKIPVQNV